MLTLSKLWDFTSNIWVFCISGFFFSPRKSRNNKPAFLPGTNWVELSSSCSIFPFAKCCRFLLVGDLSHCLLHLLFSPVGLSRCMYFVTSSEGLQGSQSQPLGTVPNADSKPWYRLCLMIFFLALAFAHWSTPVLWWFVSPRPNLHTKHRLILCLRLPIA